MYLNSGDLGLTFTTLWTNSADNKLTTFFSYFSQKTGFDISCKLSPQLNFLHCGDNLHEMPHPVFWKKKKNNQNISKCCLLKFSTQGTFVLNNFKTFIIYCKIIKIKNYKPFFLVS